MLKVIRGELAPTLQAELERRQAAVDGRRAGGDPWGDFTKAEAALAAGGQPTVRAAVSALFHGKCGYCEARGGGQIDHHRPKAPHRTLNANRGSPDFMFQWDNFIWSCECNGRSVKGTRMKWEQDGTPRLLDPTKRGDDPVCHFAIQEADTPEFAVGWIEPRAGLNAVARRRADYTIQTLKLNSRKHLVEARADVLMRFKYLEYCLERLDLDEGPPGGTLRECLLLLLRPDAPHLAVVRQIFRLQPERRQRLVERMPELDELIASWDREPDDSAPLHAPPVITPAAARRTGRR